MKIKRLFIMILLVASLVGCTGTGNTSSSSQTDGNSTSSTNQVTENAVKIKSIHAKETEVEIANVKARNRKNANNTDDLNYIIITRPQTDITFTITLDNPEAYAIDALRVTCDDENAQIQVDGEFKPIAQESDGTRVINWASEDPYTKTYNIRTTSEDAINSFKVVDVRLAGHDKFQSKETNSTDLGNNELHIYKMDEDAYTLNVIENTFDYIKFNFNIKDEYKDIISNIRVDGLEMDEELGYWMLEESKDVSITYDYYLKEYDIKVERKDSIEVSILQIQSINFKKANNYYFSYYDEEGNLVEYNYPLDKEYTLFSFSINSTLDLDIEIVINDEKQELNEIGFFQTTYSSFGELILYTDFEIPEEVYTFEEFTQEQLGMTEEEYWEKLNNYKTEDDRLELVQWHLDNCEIYYSYIRENIIDIKIKLGGVEFNVNLWGRTGIDYETNTNFEYWTIDGSTLGEYKSN